MVEGLARLVTGTMAGRAVADPSYEFYVQAYRALAWLAGWGWNASGEPCG